jgi:hypothetical protein
MSSYLERFVSAPHMIYARVHNSHENGMSSNMLVQSLTLTSALLPHTMPLYKRA